MAQIMSARQLFEGRKALLTSKHCKEKVIAPLAKESLGILVEVNNEVDTDIFGNFSGEIKRKNSPKTTVVEKCKFGLNRGNHDLGFASEGSFGPHPIIPFVPCNEELVCLIDLKNNWTFVGSSLTLETNFHGQYLSTREELEKFADRITFPSHAIILRIAEKEVKEIVKGIQDHQSLSDNFIRLKSRYGKVWAETDMRAHLNPTRMKNIGLATQNLISKINSLCPYCQTPGFEVSSIQKGLPCSVCQWPSEVAISHLYQCKTCGNSKTILYPNGKENIDPMYCQNCNP